MIRLPVKDASISFPLLFRNSTYGIGTPVAVQFISKYCPCNITFTSWSWDIATLEQTKSVSLRSSSFLPFKCCGVWHFGGTTYLQVLSWSWANSYFIVIKLSGDENYPIVGCKNQPLLLAQCTKGLILQSHDQGLLSMNNS